MSTLISLNIHLSKLDKLKIITGKDGMKYINLTATINDRPDQYGKDVAIWHEQSKEERENKDLKKQYCGNGKVLYSGQPKIESVTDASAAGSVNDNDDLPY